MNKKFKVILLPCEMCGDKTHKLTLKNDMMVCNRCLGLLHRESREKKVMRPKEYK